MNYFKQIAEMFGVELREKFKIAFDNGVVSENIYWFSEHGLEYSDSYGSTSYELEELLIGRWKIQKLPWKPKNGELYWTVTVEYGMNKIVVPSEVRWCSFGSDYKSYGFGLCFRTKKEACEIGIPKLQEVIKKYNGAK